MYDRPQRDADCSSKGDWKGMENVSVQDIVLATGGVLLSGDDGVMLNKIRLDSRQVETGDLFVPIIGEKVDAHKFLEQVAEKGAGAVLTSEHKEKTEEMAETSCAWIAVDDTKKSTSGRRPLPQKTSDTAHCRCHRERRKDHNAGNDRGGTLRAVSCIQDSGQQQQSGRSSDYRVRDHKRR